MELSASTSAMTLQGERGGILLAPFDNSFARVVVGVRLRIVDADRIHHHDIFRRRF
jgi:hypothetical protein